MVSMSNMIKSKLMTWWEKIQTILIHSLFVLAFSLQRKFPFRRIVFDCHLNPMILKNYHLAIHAKYEWRLIVFFPTRTFLLQVLSKAKEDEPYGWWPATTKMFKGDFFVVDYKVIAQGAGYSDIVASDKIRCPNTKYAL